MRRQFSHSPPGVPSRDALLSILVRAEALLKCTPPDAADREALWTDVIACFKRRSREARRAQSGARRSQPATRGQ